MHQNFDKNLDTKYYVALIYGKYPSYTFTFKPLSLTRCTFSLTKHLSNIVLNTTTSLLHFELSEAWAPRPATT